jgi:hypothetical protein
MTYKSWLRAIEKQGNHNYDPAPLIKAVRPLARGRQPDPVGQVP